EVVIHAADRIEDSDRLLLLTRSAHLEYPLVASASLAVAVEMAFEPLNDAVSVRQILNRFGDDIGCERRALDQPLVEAHFLREELEGAVAALLSAVKRTAIEKFGSANGVAGMTGRGDRDRLRHAADIQRNVRSRDVVQLDFNAIPH